MAPILQLTDIEKHYGMVIALAGVSLLLTLAKCTACSATMELANPR
jgi:hypothetical protein